MRELLVLACLCGVANAEPPSREANRLFEDGRAQLKAGNYAAACPLLEQSYELERAPGTQLNLGDCDEHADKLRDAWLLYDAAAREYERTNRPKQAEFARHLADALAPRLATVIVKLAASNTIGLTLRIGDRTMAPEALHVERLDPGAVEIAVRAPGRVAFATTVTAELGREVTVDIPPLEPADPAAKPLPSAPAPAPGNPWRTAAFAGGTVTVIAAATWAVVTVELASVDNGDLCVPRPFRDDRFACQHGDQLSIAGNIAIPLTLAAGAFTGYAVYRARRAGRSLIVTPAASAALTGVWIEGRW